MFKLHLHSTTVVLNYNWITKENRRHVSIQCHFVLNTGRGSNRYGNSRSPPHAPPSFVASNKAISFSPMIGRTQQPPHSNRAPIGWSPRQSPLSGKKNGQKCTTRSPAPDSYRKRDKGWERERGIRHKME